MQKELVIVGGFLGAIFTGVSVWALTARHVENYPLTASGYPNYTLVTGYPDLAAISVAIAIFSFVIMLMGLLSNKMSNKN